MDAMIILLIVGLLILFIAVPILISRVVNKAGNKIEQKVRKGAYAQEQQLLGTVKHYRTTMPVAAIQAQLDRNVVVGIGGRDLKKLAQSQNQIVYGVNTAVAGFQARIIFEGSETETTAHFHFTNCSKSSGVSEMLREMRDLAQAVDYSFRSADPGVQVFESQQKFGAAM